MGLIPDAVCKPVTDPAKLRVMIMAAPKSGKTTFCAQNPKALVLDTDYAGAQFVACLRVNVGDWVTLKASLGEAAKEENKGRFSTIVLDTVDAAWQRCREFVCSREGINHESEDKGFGRVWDLVKAEFTKMLSFIAAQGWGVWMTTHTVTKEAKVGGVKRQVTTSTLPASASRVLMALADVIGYIDIKDDGRRVLVVKQEDTLEVGDRTGHLTENIVYSTPKEGFDAMMAKFNIEEKKP